MGHDLCIFPSHTTTKLQPPFYMNTMTGKTIITAAAEYILFNMNTIPSMTGMTITTAATEYILFYMNTIPSMTGMTIVTAAADHIMFT